MTDTIGQFRIPIGHAKQLDAPASALPMASGDRDAEVLTHGDVATLKHLADTRMRANTLRALACLEAWCRAATGRPRPWLADPELVFKFIAHHV